jgi:DNA-binding response OmpR family regulator
VSIQILSVAQSLGDKNLLGAAFRRAGLTVHACDGAALAGLQLAPFALAVIDAPVFDGWARQMLATLQASVNGPPALVYTEQIDARSRLEALSAGAGECVGNPCDPELLVARAMALLARSKGTDPPTPQGLGRTILVVDDSTTYAYALNDELRRDGHDVALAGTGREALQFLAVQTPDLVILDVFLPDMTGIDLCAKLRETPGLARTPVLFLTGRERSAARERGLRAESEDLVVKSRALDAIRLHVRRMLSGEDRSPAPSPPSSARTAAATEVPLLDRITAAMGLSKLVGRSAVLRACKRLGVAPERLTPSDVERAMPDIEQAMRVFLPREQADANLCEVAKLTRS